LVLTQAEQRQWILNVLSLLEEDLGDMDLEVAVVLEDFLKWKPQARYPMGLNGQWLLVQEERERIAQQMVPVDLIPQLLAQASQIPPPLVGVGEADSEVAHLEVLGEAVDLEITHQRNRVVLDHLVKVMLEEMEKFLRGFLQILLQGEEEEPLRLEPMAL
jgi:hypothetical protein